MRSQEEREGAGVRSPLIGNALPKPPPRRSILRGWRRHLLPAMLFSTVLFVFFILYRFTVGKPLPYSRLPRNALIVRLPEYGTFKGTQIVRHLKGNTPLDVPVDSYLGVEYARQPVGEYRFAPPDWPASFNGTKDATEYGPACIQNGDGSGQSEACLSCNVFRTPGVSYKKKLPVLVFLHGGSFVLGSSRGFDGAGFVARSKEPVMVVTPNYRLSALGSLPSALFEEEGLLNLGIQDQRLLLKFLQRYISSFGGDPNRVTLSGQSAGGHSVGIHLFHNYGDDEGKPLFSQAILSSGSPVARSFPEATFPLYQRYLKEFMDYLGCPMSDNTEALKCLRSADVRDIRNIQSRIYSSSEYNITWPFQPVSPGPILEKRGSMSGKEGTFWKVPTLISSATNEGAGFAPQNLYTTEDFTKFIGNVNPGLTPQDLLDLESIYQDPDQSGSPYADSPVSKQYKRIAAAYGDYSYICPVQDTATHLANAGVPVYKARFNTPNWAPEWQGVPHASDSAYFMGMPDAQFPDIAELYHSYWASFVVSGDPNKYAVNGAPWWERYEGVGSQQLVVGSRSGSGTRMEWESEGIRMDACAWWNYPERMERLKK